MSDASLKTITDSMRDLEKAKSSLEKRLDEVRQGRLLAEDTHSVWQLRLSQSSQERALSLQRLHLAQSALGQSHAKHNTQRKLFDRKNESVKSLHSQIEEEKARQKKTASEYENVMDSIGQSLKDLRIQYSPDQLKTQIENMDVQVKHLRVQTSIENQRNKTLKQKLEKLTAGSAGEEDGVTEGWKDLKTLHGDQQLIQSLLFDDQVKVRERICNVTQQLQYLEAEGNQLES